jgi:putative methyltransferase (TIGR04325 family)
MHVKTLITRILPPVFMDAYRALRRTPTWAGVYLDFSAVPATDASRRGAAWLAASVDPADYDELPADVLKEHDFFAILAASVYRRNGGRLRILDVGGGLGVSYVHLLHTLPDASGLDYHIVDLEWACREGSRRFATDYRVHYHRRLPDDLPDLDIIHLTETLEYVEDYSGLLRRLCACGPQYLLLVGLHAGPFLTYATAQLNIPGVVIPQWFFNLDEVVGMLEACGYRPIFKGEENGVIDQRNFPEDYRLPGGRPLVLLFAPASLSRRPGADGSLLMIRRNRS